MCLLTKLRICVLIGLTILAIYLARNHLNDFNYFEENYFASQTITQYQCACSDIFRGVRAGHSAKWKSDLKNKIL